MGWMVSLTTIFKTSAEEERENNKNTPANANLRRERSSFIDASSSLSLKTSSSTILSPLAAPSQGAGVSVQQYPISSGRRGLGLAQNPPAQPSVRGFAERGSTHWRRGPRGFLDLIFGTDPRGVERMSRITYEICVVLARRDRLHCKEI